MSRKKKPGAKRVLRTNKCANPHCAEINPYKKGEHQRVSPFFRKLNKAQERMYCSFECYHHFSPMKLETCYRLAPTHKPSIDTLKRVIIEMYQIHHAWSEVEKAMGIPHATLALWKKELNVPLAREIRDKLGLVL